ncbi:hypothetical protein M3Y99_00612000 [Aphelenchoides fujianensis]|nr:hypothetical protein M3Y99_00612000 [Aphelenchoides fujianensis]
MSLPSNLFRNVGRSLATRPLRCASTTKAAEHKNDEPLGREVYLDNRVVRLIFNSPKNRNAMSLEFMSLLHKELREIDKIEKIRAVILAAEGPAFSAGHDLKQLTGESGKDKHKELPVIAEVSGVAAAAGCQLVSTCDVVVASECSKFSVPGLKAGLFCSTPGIPLARSIPHKLAMDMLLTARSISAEGSFARSGFSIEIVGLQKPLRAGLVSRVVPKDEVRFESLRVAEEITKMSRSVTALGKAFYYVQCELKLTEAYRLGESVMTENLKFADCQEGIDSFINKRSPTWTHTTDRVL